MKGRALLVPTLPSDYAHFVVACLMHDIGYVRGILKGDGPDGYVTDATGRVQHCRADRPTQDFAYR
jgi:hypothetical protein